MKKNINRVFLLYFLLFLMTIGYLFMFVSVDSKRIINNITNPRMRSELKGVTRGDVYDCNGITLVTTEDGKRQYLYPDLLAHVTGFEHNSVYHTKCIESEYFFSMQKLDNEIFRRIQNILDDSTPLQGNSIVLTIDSGLQKLAYDSLKSTGLKGAIVVLEPATGKVLAMVSSPAYNLENLDKILSDEMKGDDSKFDSPLINRATQGLYPPGSTFKIVTAAAAMENLENWQDLTYECTGEETFYDSRIRCYNGQAHGTVDLGKAFTVSCNTYFAQLGHTVGSGELAKTAERFYFNRDLSRYYFPLETASASFSVKTEEHEQIEQAAIGQGDTLTTPLHMAMLTAAVANGGVMMKPYIADHHLTYSGKQINKTMPSMIGQVVSPEIAYELKNMMVSVVNDGTGIDTKINGVLVAGKTGTAQIKSTDNPSSSKALRDHAWFVGFAPADDPSVCVAVLLENGEKGRYAGPIAKKIINYCIEE